MIEGKVAAILNERQLVINRGEDQGVEIDMEFAVLEPAGVRVTDPETDKVIGEVNSEKIRVRIVRVEPHLSVGQTFEQYGGRMGLGRAYTDIFKEIAPQLRTLRTSDALFKPITSAESFVQRGDPVRQVG